MPYTAVNGLEFHYRIDGPDGAPWVTFSNSLATDLHLWDAQVAEIEDRYRILRYDTRGHGKTAAPPPPYDFALLESDVIGLWDRLGIARSHYVGLSLGGSTGFGLAINYPERIASLAGCDCRVTSPPAFKAAWESRVEMVEKGGTAAVVEDTMNRWFTGPTLAADGPDMERIRTMIRETSANGFIGCANALQGIEYLEAARTIACPTLIIVGENDPAATPELAGAMHQRVAGSRLEVLPDAAHISNIENPAAFNAALIPFLDAVVAEEAGNAGQ
ncbi:MAG: alpha/beta fold hydrolase [Alphaproteobacteria bacterium]|nr:alpha/beta fold hydrolase [Alphaproteobacteria bacterium]